MGWIDQYKDAILQAVWATGVSLVTTDEETMSGKDDTPTLRVAVDLLSQKDSVAKAFADELKKVIGDQTFMVYACPYRVAAQAPYVVCEGLKWKLK